MEKIQLLNTLFLCLAAAAVFILGIISERSQNRVTLHLLILPIGKETQNIELIAREILCRAEEFSEETLVVIYDKGANSEQLQIFDKIVGESLDYVVIKE